MYTMSTLLNRLSVNLSEAEMATLKRLRDRTGSHSQTETVIRAIRIHDRLTEWMDAGDVILRQTPDGRQEAIVFL
jgi:hypothetical protein